MTNIFDQQAASYDAWYDAGVGRAVFGEELAALQPLLANLPHPWLEVGVGTGRFAAALGAEYGIDPSLASLSFAARRQVRVAVARGEALPFRPHVFGAVLIITTLCFVADPLAVLAEAGRVVRSDGGIVLGIVPGDGPWGQHYQTLAAAGHVYYQHAQFFDRAELAALLETAGLRPVRTRSALFWAPQEKPPTAGTALEGAGASAGFVALLEAPDGRGVSAAS